MLGDLFLKGFNIMVLGNRRILKVTYKTSPCIRWTQEFVYVKDSTKIRSGREVDIL